MTAAEIRAQAREAIHVQFAHAAHYTDSGHGVPVPLNVRWHGQNVAPIGDFEGAGYARILDRVDRIIFLRSELTAAALVLGRGGRVSFPLLGGATFILDHLMPADGPTTELWTVTPDGVIAP